MRSISTAISKVSIITAGVASISFMAVGQAQAASFNFSFTNGANDGGNVTGLIQGLPSDGTGAATSVQVLTNTAGFGIGEYIGNPSSNSFTVTSGVITQADFSSFGIKNNLPAVTSSSLDISSSADSQSAGLTYNPYSYTRENTPIQFTARENTPVQFTAADSVPEPSDILGTLAFGVIGAGYLLKRQLKKAI